MPPSSAPPGLGRRARRPAALCRPEPLRLPRRARRRGARSAARARLHPPSRVRRAGCDDHEPCGRSRRRFRLALLRAGVRHRRRPGDRIDALLPGAVLEPAAEQARLRRAPGLRARRDADRSRSTATACASAARRSRSCAASCSRRRSTLGSETDTTTTHEDSPRSGVNRFTYLVIRGV